MFVNANFNIQLLAMATSSSECQQGSGSDKYLFDYERELLNKNGNEQGMMKSFGMNK